VLQNLRANVILEETLLATVDAYNQHSRGFVLSENTTQPCIGYGRVKKDREGAVQRREAPTEEGAMSDSTRLEDGRYEK
jgi:hypothetical protein